MGLRCFADCERLVHRDDVNLLVGDSEPLQACSSKCARQLEAHWSSETIDFWESTATCNSSADGLASSRARSWLDGTPSSCVGPEAPVRGPETRCGGAASAFVSARRYAKGPYLILNKAGAHALVTCVLERQ